MEILINDGKSTVMHVEKFQARKNGMTSLRREHNAALTA